MQVPHKTHKMNQPMFKQKMLSNIRTPTSTFTLNILLKLNQQKNHQVKIYNSRSPLAQEISHENIKIFSQILPMLCKLKMMN
jgi:hypothetical protein